MCGIAGFFDPACPTGAARAQLQAMTDAIAHRGPDASGHHIDAPQGIALGHRRLSILDLSPSGAQPMESPDGRYWIAFNGEVYNHLDLRQDLTRSQWRGTSDTETLLAAFEEWGVEATLRRANGMWAFALWDRREHALIFARDRFGKKPLLLGPTGSGIAWSSELSALRILGDCPQKIDLESARQFLRYGCVPAPRTILSGVVKMMPGTWLRLEATDLQAMPKVLPRDRAAWVLRHARAYWSLLEEARAGLADPLDLPYDEVVDRVDDQLRKSVARRCIADVPLGAFLSGGVDSSAIVSLMQAQASGPVRTFSIGFNEAGFDESSAAEAVAQHLGTQHTSLRVGEEEALQTALRLTEIYDEPFADSSQIPTFLVSQLARESVTVALSGDGGDELFAGYNRHTWVPRFERRFSRWPNWMRATLATALASFSEANWNRIYRSLQFALPKVSHPGRKIAKISRLLRASDRDEVYRSLVAFCQEPETLLLSHAGGAFTPSPVPTWELPTEADLPGAHVTHRLMLADQRGYLPDDILVKLDRASMAVGLEGRNPILDPEVLSLAWRIPLAQQQERGAKSVLKSVLARYVPESLFERPKQGFSIPLSTWLRGGLKEWGEELLSEASLQRSGLLEPQAVGTLWKQHQSARADHSSALWAILMLQAWCEKTGSTG